MHQPNIISNQKLQYQQEKLEHFFYQTKKNNKMIKKIIVKLIYTFIA